MENTQNLLNEVTQRNHGIDFSKKKSLSVKDFIILLSTLDPDKNIWVVYDGYEAYAPFPDGLGFAYCPFEELGPDDYLISVG